jgi:hypothetical protein
MSGIGGAADTDFDCRAASPMVGPRPIPVVARTRPLRRNNPLISACQNWYPDPSSGKGEANEAAGVHCACWCRGDWVAAHGACAATGNAGDRVSPQRIANAALEFRWAEGRYDQLPVLVADLVSCRVAVIVTQGGDPPLLAAKSATSTIPIVFTSSSSLSSASSTASTGLAVTSRGFGCTPRYLGQSALNYCNSCFPRVH